MCDECCSVHRSLGRHISIVKHLRHSAWPPTLLQVRAVPGRASFPVACAERWHVSPPPRTHIHSCLDPAASGGSTHPGQNPILTLSTRAPAHTERRLPGPESHRPGLSPQLCHLVARPCGVDFNVSEPWCAHHVTRSAKQDPHPWLGWPDWVGVQRCQAHSRPCSTVSSLVLGGVPQCAVGILTLAPLPYRWCTRSPATGPTPSGSIPCWTPRRCRAAGAKPTPKTKSSESGLRGGG